MSLAHDSIGEIARETHAHSSKPQPGRAWRRDGGVNAEDDSGHHGDQGRSHGRLEESLGCGKIETGAMYHVAVPGSDRMEFG